MVTLQVLFGVCSKDTTKKSFPPNFCPNANKLLRRHRIFFFCKSALTLTPFFIFYRRRIVRSVFYEFHFLFRLPLFSRAAKRNKPALKKTSQGRGGEGKKGGEKRNGKASNSNIFWEVNASAGSMVKRVLLLPLCGQNTCLIPPFLCLRLALSNEMGEGRIWKKQGRTVSHWQK